MDSLPNRASIDSRPKKVRSAVSNGSRQMLGADGRTMWVRRYRDYIEDHVACYSAENMSVPRMALLRRQAAQLVECELLEAKMSERRATFEDIDQHNRLVGNVRRNYEQLGMDSVAKIVSNGVIDHFASVADKCTK